MAEKCRGGHVMIRNELQHHGTTTRNLLETWKCLGCNKKFSFFHGEKEHQSIINNILKKTATYKSYIQGQNEPLKNGAKTFQFPLINQKSDEITPIQVQYRSGLGQNSTFYFPKQENSSKQEHLKNFDQGRALLKLLKAMPDKDLLLKRFKNISVI